MLDLMLYQICCYKDGSLLLFYMDSIHYFILKQGNKTTKHVKRMSAAAVHTETSPKTNSRAAQSLGMKNETAIIVITGLWDHIVGKTGRKEKF